MDSNGTGIWLPPWFNVTEIPASVVGSGTTLALTGID